MPSAASAFLAVRKTKDPPYGSATRQRTGWVPKILFGVDPGRNEREGENVACPQRTVSVCSVREIQIRGLSLISGLFETQRNKDPRWIKPPMRSLHFAPPRPTSARAAPKANGRRSPRPHRPSSFMEALKPPASFSGEPGPGGPRSLPPARPATGFFPPHPHDPLPTGEPEPTAAHRDAATLPEAPSLGPCRVPLRGSGQGSPLNPSRGSIRAQRPPLTSKPSRLRGSGASPRRSCPSCSR